MSSLEKYEPFRMFEMKMQDGNYHVRYTLKPHIDNTAELEYYEWVDEGELKEPFNIGILTKLKNVIEKKTA